MSVAREDPVATDEMLVSPTFLPEAVVLDCASVPVSLEGIFCSSRQASHHGFNFFGMGGCSGAGSGFLFGCRETLIFT
jgi:hypothetical protein